MNTFSFAPACALVLAGLVGCGAVAQSAPNAGTGPNPTLPSPEKNLIPTVNGGTLVLKTGSSLSIHSNIASP